MDSQPELSENEDVIEETENDETFETNTSMMEEAASEAWRNASRVADFPSEAQSLEEQENPRFSRELAQQESEEYVPKVGRPRLYTANQIRKKRAEYHKRWYEKKRREREMEAARHLKTLQELQALQELKRTQSQSQQTPKKTDGYNLDVRYSNGDVEQAVINDETKLKDVLKGTCAMVLEDIDVKNRGELVRIIQLMGNLLVKYGHCVSYKLY